MGILTNFLKLLKPEPNDFVDVAKHISENYDKLDENAKSNDETLTNLNNNKLDKGTYPGDAGTLNTEISKIASTTQLGRIIVGKGMTADSTGKVSIISKNDGIVVNDNDIELNIVDNLTTNSPTRSLSAKQGKKLFDEKQNITDIVNNLTTTVPGKVLDGRQGPAIVNKINGLAGGYSGTFPLTTAVKEGIYLLPATNKFYVCVENYNGSSLTAPNANFEELSVFQNRNKLENLFTFKAGFITDVNTNSKIIFDCPFKKEKIIVLLTQIYSDISDNSYRQYKVLKDNDLTGFTIKQIATQSQGISSIYYIALGY